jgi:hypothetical protein
VEISELEVEIEDVEWFAIDSEGEIAHFTSGAYGLLPKSVTQSRENLDVITDFFSTELQVTTLGEIDDKAFSMVNLRSDSPEIRQIVFEESLEMASKGLYSYDSYDAVANSEIYFRVSLPNVPLRIDSLPPHIRRVIEVTSLKNTVFKRDRIINKETILNP